MNKKIKARNEARVHYKLFKYPCLLCGSMSTVKHHVDYNKPLNVLWLCKHCHSMLHANKLDSTRIRLINNCYRWFYIDKWVTYDWYIENKATYPKRKRILSIVHKEK